MRKVGFEPTKFKTSALQAPPFVHLGIFSSTNIAKTGFEPINMAYETIVLPITLFRTPEKEGIAPSTHG